MGQPVPGKPVGGCHQESDYQGDYGKPFGGHHSQTLQPCSPRIAYFVVHGWTEPLDMDVGVPSFSCRPSWPTEDDSTHKLLAAYYLGKESVEADVAGEQTAIEYLCA